MIQVQQSQLGADLLGGIQRGMPVYDADDIKLGVVRRIHPGSGVGASIPDAVEVIQDMIDLPTILRARLYHEGCIEVDTGLLSGNYCVLPRQIADVTGEAIFLLCCGDELIVY